MLHVHWAILLLIIAGSIALGIGINYIATYSINQKRRQQSYYKGWRDAGATIHDLHYWFNGFKFPAQVINVLFIIGHNLMKNASVGIPDQVRGFVEKLGGNPYHKIDKSEYEKYL